MEQNTVERAKKEEEENKEEDRNRYRNTIKRSRQARLVYVEDDINCKIPTSWRWALAQGPGKESAKLETRACFCLADAGSIAGSVRGKKLVS